MKSQKLILTAALLGVFGVANAVTLSTEAQKIGYAIGMEMGQSVIELGDKKDIDLDAIISGLKDSYDGAKLAMTQEEGEKVMQEFATRRMKEMQQQFEKEAAENAAAGKKFLEDNGKKEGVQTTASGLQYKVDKEGDGAKPTAKDTVTVNYEGKLINGTVFDSSYKRGEPVTFAVSQVIPGWVEGLQLMKAGSTYTFYVPANLAYGEAGAAPAIPPNSTLIFKVELLKVEAPKADAKADAKNDSKDAAQPAAAAPAEAKDAKAAQ